MALESNESMQLITVASCVALPLTFLWLAAGSIAKREISCGWRGWLARENNLQK